MWGLSRLKRGRGRRAGMGVLVAVDAVAAVLLVLELGMALFFRPIRRIQHHHVEPQLVRPPLAAGQQPRLPRRGAASKGGGGKARAGGGGFLCRGPRHRPAEDRFGDVLGRDLGPGWRVAQAARIGWDTVDEDEALRAYPVVPDVVVLAYFVNDIYRAAEKSHFPLPFAVRFPQGALAKYLVDHFALANFAYWRLVRVGNVDDAARGFWDRLGAAYADPQVFAAHAAELSSIVDWCRNAISG